MSAEVVLLFLLVIKHSFADLFLQTFNKNIDKTKYLVPNNLTVGELVYVIRKRMKLEPEKAIFFFINETIPNTSLQLSQLYESHKNEDGFLYMKYSSENTFGSIN